MSSGMTVRYGVLCCNPFDEPFDRVLLKKSAIICGLMKCDFEALVPPLLVVSTQRETTRLDHVNAHNQIEDIAHPIITP